MVINKCVVCGKEFEARNISCNLCSDECRKIRQAEHEKNQLTFKRIIPTEYNLKIKDILKIMQKYKISYADYVENREFYVRSYKYGENQ